MAIPRKDAREIARSKPAGGRKHAGRLFRDWDEELAVDEIGDPHLSPTKRVEMREALGILAERHPGIERDTRRGIEPPNFSRAAKTKVWANRGLARANEQVGRGTRAAQARGGRVGRSAYRQSGIPGAATDWTRTTLQMLGGMVGVSILYLLLTNAGSKGAGNVPGALWAGATAFRRLFSPASDILGGGPPLAGLFNAPIVPLTPASPSVPRAAITPPTAVPRLGGVPIKTLRQAGLIGPLHLGPLTVPTR